VSARGREVVVVGKVLVSAQEKGRRTELQVGKIGVVEGGIVDAEVASMVGRVEVGSTAGAEVEVRNLLGSVVEEESCSLVMEGTAWASARAPDAADMEAEVGRCNAAEADHRRHSNLDLT